MTKDFEPKISYDVVFLGLVPEVGETRDWTNEKGQSLGEGTVIYAGTHAGGICHSRSKVNCINCKVQLCKTPLSN